MSNSEKRSLFLPDGLQIGTIIRKFVNFTIPPKYKYLVVVGITGDRIAYAAMVINSEINSRFVFNDELLSHHIPLKVEDCPFLEHDSFVDCTTLREDTMSNFNAAYNEKPDIYRGSMPTPQMDIIVKTILDSDLIKGKMRKKFKMFDYSFDDRQEAAE